MYDIGDTFRATVTVRDAAGTPVNASTITLTYTLPDGTTSTPSITNPPAQTGIYINDFVITQAGRHTLAWTSTVPNTGYTDVFNAWALTSNAIVGLAETKEHLNITLTDTTWDEELRRTIRGASAVVEGIVGACARRTVTEVLSGRGGTRIYLNLAPVLSITSIVEDGVTLATSGAYTLKGDRGVITRANGVGWSTTEANNITVTYVPGRVVIPDNILEGTKDLIRANFRPQLGGNRMPFDTNPGAANTGGEMRLGFFVPNSVMERLVKDQQGPFYM
jgi:hypothetical protein